jgi:ribosome-associated protein
MQQSTPRIVIPEHELEFDFIRSGGPGGQNVNKVATGVQLRFCIIHSPTLSEPHKTRLLQLCGKRVNKEGVLVIEATRHRSQERNRQDAIERLHEWIAQTATAPKRRIKTRVPRSAKKKRLETKSLQGHRKASRRKPGLED